MATKQTETQNFFDMYNNLGDQRQLIEREIKMLNLVQEGFDACGANQHTKVCYEPGENCLMLVICRLSLWLTWRICWSVSERLARKQSKVPVIGLYDVVALLEDTQTNY